MTKLRAPCSRHQAMLDVVEVIGWDGACAATSLKERSARKLTEPDCAPRLDIEAALAMDIAVIAAGGQVAPFEAWYRLHLQLARAQASAAVAAVEAAAERVALAARETGEALAACVIAAAPGATLQERRRADRETEEAIVALARTLPPEHPLAGGSL